MIMTEYKESEVGSIPADWDVVALREIGSFSKGNGISRDDSSTGNIPAIRYGELYVNQHDYIREFTSHISPEVAKIACPIHNGDLMFTASGETKEDIGKSIAYSGEEEAYAGGDLIILSPHRELNPIFMGYLTNAEYVRKQKELRAQGDAVVHITASSIGEIIVALPPRDEQNRIADALVITDSLISSLDELIEKKRMIKDGLMQELLTGKKRLKGFSGKWETVKLNEIAEMSSGGTPSSKEVSFYGGDIPFLSISDMTSSGKYIFRTEKTITKLGLENSSARVFPPGTLMYAMYASLGKCSITNIEVAISQAILGFKLSPRVDKMFLYYHFCYIEESVKKIGQTGTQSNLSKQIVENFALELPEIDEQKAIGRVLSDIDLEISTIESMRDKYLLIKQGMMQQLLTGKTRL